MITVKGGGGMLNNPPVINEFKVINVGPRNIAISYKVEDDDLQIVRHFLTVHSDTGVIINKKDITKELGYEKPNNIFSYNISNLTRNTNYTIQLECTDGLVSTFVSLEQRTENTVIYELIVNENNSNSFTSVTYGGDAVGTEPAVSSDLKGWRDKWPFNKIRLVGLKNGKVTKEIQKNNKKLYVDGTRVDADPDVDVMTEFPKIYWKFVKQANGYKIIISDKKFEGGDCFAHKRNGKENDFAYLGSYIASQDSQKRLRSVSGKSNCSSDSSTYFNNANRGPGYQVEYWNLFNLRIILIFLATKCRNIPLIFGQSPGGGKIGALDTSGFMYGNPNEKVRNNIFGIEDFYGCITLIKGIIQKEIYGSGYQKNLYVATNNEVEISEDKWKNLGRNIFPNSGSEYTGYFKNIRATNELGFLPIVNNLQRGSSSVDYGGSVYYAPGLRYYYMYLKTHDGNRTNDFRSLLQFIFAKDYSNTDMRLSYLEV